MIRVVTAFSLLLLLIMSIAYSVFADNNPIPVGINSSGHIQSQNWNTWRCDFTSLPSGNFGFIGDGTVSLTQCKNWQGGNPTLNMTNIANDRSQVNGGGGNPVGFTPTLTGWSGTVLTAPYMWLKFSDIIPGFSVRTPFWIECEMNESGLTLSTEGCFCGVYNGKTGTSTDHFESGLTNVSGVVSYYGITKGGVVGNSTANTNSAVAGGVLFVWGPVGWTGRYYSGPQVQSESQWPDISLFVVNREFQFNLDLTAGNGVNTGAGSVSGNDSTNYQSDRIVMGGFSVSATSVVCNFDAIRVDWKNDYVN